MVDKGKLTKFGKSAQRLTEHHQRTVKAAQRLYNSPTMQGVRALHENSAKTRLMVDIERQEAVIRAAQSPFEELRKSGVFERASALQEQLDPIREVMDAFNARFTLPEVPAAMKLMQEFQQSSGAEAMARYATRADDILRAMEAMHTPWLDAQETLRSVTGLAEIHGIGRMLENMPAFDDTVCAALRVDLGDWREKIIWPKHVLTDVGARAKFYEDLGFDTALTDFPAPAFRESTEIAGLRREPPPVVAAYVDPVPRANSDNEESALALTNVAHDWLQRLEFHLRDFIDSRMTEAFGQDWPKHQLPNGMYDAWKRKREAAVKAGRQPLPLIAYADFTDYEQVICRKDNWRHVFSSYFVRKESVRESFQRLHPIRLDTMHARPIIQDDEMLLYVEVRRLVSVIFK